MTKFWTSTLLLSNDMSADMWLVIKGVDSQNFNATSLFACTPLLRKKLEWSWLKWKQVPTCTSKCTRIFLGLTNFFHNKKFNLGLVPLLTNYDELARKSYTLEQQTWYRVGLFSKHFFENYLIPEQVNIKIDFSNFSCRFYNPNYFFQCES